MAGLGSFFKKRRDRSVDPSESAGPEGVDLTVNDGVERRQRMLLLAGGSLLVIAAAYWLFFTGADAGNEVDDEAVGDDVVGVDYVDEFDGVVGVLC